MPCSTCGAEGTNKSTCPFNPAATNPNPAKHNSAPIGSGTMTLTKPPQVVPPKPQVVPPKPQVVPPKPQVVPPKPVVIAPLLPTVKPGQYTQAELDEMDADMVRLSLPSVPVVRQAVDANIATNCDMCHRYIKNKWTPQVKMSEIDYYNNMHAFCHKCAGLISAQYQVDVKNNNSRFKGYHKGKTVTLDDIIAFGNKDGFYNSTMHHGAEFWANVGSRRKTESTLAALAALPTLPPLPKKK